MKLSKPAFGHSLGIAHYVFVIVLLIRLIVLARLTASPLLLPARGDMHFYDEWAHRILQGQLSDGRAFYGLPLYAYLLAFIYKLTGYGPFIPSLLQAGLEAGTAALSYKLGVRIFSIAQPGSPFDSRSFLPTRGGQFIGLVAAIGWAFFTPAQAYAVVLMPTVWFVFAFWLLVWLTVKSEVAPSYVACLGYGLIVGFVAMGIATILFVLPLLLVAILVRPSVPGRTVQPFMARTVAVALVFAGVGIGASPCWLHNYFVAHDPVILSAHSGVNYWIGNNPSANGYPKFPPGLHAGQQAMLADSISAAERSAGHSLKRSQVSAYWSDKTKNYIGSHFSDWVKLLGTKTKNFWSAFQYDDLSIITNLREGGVIFPGLSFGLVAALAIPGMFFAWRVAPGSRWIIGAVLLSMLSLLPVFVTERYRLVAGPGLLLLAAFGLSAFWRACETERFRTGAVYLALLIASTIFVAWPQRDPSLWALDAYNSGWQALESDDLATAERKLGLAYAYVPTNPETNFALGNLRLARGEKDAARTFYRATLQFDPNHQRAYNNLGVLELEEHRWNEAAEFFRKALQQDPLNAKTHYLLAKARFQAGDLATAKTEILEALRLNPAPAEFHELKAKLELGGRSTIAD